MFLSGWAELNPDHPSLAGREGRVVEKVSASLNPAVTRKDLEKGSRTVLSDVFLPETAKLCVAFLF